MLRRILFASAIAFGAAGAAQAQNAPQMVGGGEDAVVDYGGAPAGAAVGGGTVALSGGGDNRSYTYGAVNALPGRAGRLVGGGDNAQVIYAPDAPAAVLARGRAGSIRG